MVKRERKTHRWKTWPEPFSAVLSGRKHHEVRMDDRDAEEGDVAYLDEWDPETREYTGAYSGPWVIGYISRGPEWGLPHGLCVFTLRAPRYRGG